MCLNHIKILAVLTILLAGCCAGIEQPLNPTSSDGSFFVETDVNDGGIIMLNIFSGQKKITSIDTRASLYQNFAIGWVKNKNTLVINSSDIGTYAWQIEGGVAKNLDGSQYVRYGEQRYETKYE